MEAQDHPSEPDQEQSSERPNDSLAGDQQDPGPSRPASLVASHAVFESSVNLTDTSIEPRGIYLFQDDMGDGERRHCVRTCGCTRKEVGKIFPERVTEELRSVVVGT